MTYPWCVRHREQGSSCCREQAPDKRLLFIHISSLVSFLLSSSLTLRNKLSTLASFIKCLRRCFFNLSALGIYMLSTNLKFYQDLRSHFCSEKLADVNPDGSSLRRQLE